MDELAEEIRGELPDELVPEGDTDLLFRLYALLALAKGERVTAADVHNAWAAWMQERNPGHPAIRPFDDLNSNAQEADEPFVHAIRAVIATRSGGTTSEPSEGPTR